MRTWIVMCCTLTSGWATGTLAAETQGKKAVKTAPKLKVPVLDLPKFDAVPSTEGMKRPAQEAPQKTTATEGTPAAYAITQVTHARGFTRAGAGYVAQGKLSAIGIRGDPPMIERFSTVIRVKCPQRQSAPVTVLLLDDRDQTVMSAQGEVTFRGPKSTETDYRVDWESSPWPRGGDFKLEIKISGQSMGSWPVKFVQR